MTIHFVSIGKIKNPALASLFDYYLKLIGKFAEVSHTTLKIKSTDKTDNEVMDWLLRRPQPSYLTVLDEKGKTFDSRAFSGLVQTIQDGSFKEWILLCGAEHGFGPKISEKARLRLSLSPLTFPHEIAQAVLSEQIFRAFTLIHGQAYHND